MGEKLPALFFPTEKIEFNPPKKVDTNAIRRDEGKYLEKKVVCSRHSKVNDWISREP